MRVTDPKLVNETYVDDGQLGLDVAALPEIEAKAGSAGAVEGQAG